MISTECLNCGKGFEHGTHQRKCPDCSGPVGEVCYHMPEDSQRPEPSLMMNQRYRDKWLLRNRRGILISAFAALTGYVVTDGVSKAIQFIRRIPIDEVGIVLWGDTFFLRIIGALIGALCAGFIVGIAVKNKRLLYALVASLPTVAFWLAVLLLPSFWLYGAQGSTYPQSLLPYILIIATPIASLLGMKLSNHYIDDLDSERSNTIIGIKWFHWIWILPLYLNKVIAIPLILLIIGWINDKGQWYNTIAELLFNTGSFLVVLITYALLIGSLASIGYVFQMLREKKVTVQQKVYIILNVLLLQLLYLPIALSFIVN